MDITLPCTIGFCLSHFQELVSQCYTSKHDRAIRLYSRLCELQCQLYRQSSLALNQLRLSVGKAMHLTIDKSRRFSNIELGKTRFKRLVLDTWVYKNNVLTDSVSLWRSSRTKKNENFVVNFLPHPFNGSHLGWVPVHHNWWDPELPAWHHQPVSWRHLQGTDSVNDN